MNVMPGTLAIFERELRSFFYSQLAYVVITLFVLLAGFFFMEYLITYNLVLDRFYAGVLQTPSGSPPAPDEWVLENFFQTLLALLVFVVPFLTMRCVAEERRQGTFELLLTLPVSDAAIVLGKFLALTVVMTVMLFAAMSFPLILCFKGSASLSLVCLGSLCLLLAAMAFSALGIAISALTRSQLVAGMATLALLLLLYVASAQAGTLQGAPSVVLRQLSPVTHSAEWLSGILSSEAVVYFLSIVVFALCAGRCFISRVRAE